VTSPSHILTSLRHRLGAGRRVGLRAFQETRAPSGGAIIFIAAFVLMLLSVSVSSALAAEPPEPPETKPVSEITGTSATFNGVVNPGLKSQSGVYQFFYRRSAAECEGESATAGGPVLGLGPEPVSEPVTGLEPNTEYTVCLAARNITEEQSVGTATKATFKTLAVPPTVLSEAVSHHNKEGVPLGAGEARLEGVLNPNNQLTECHFQYGEASVSEHEVPCEPELLKGFGEQGVAAIVGGFSGGPYHYRILAKNGKGEETMGAEQTVLPPEAPEKAPATGITTAEATLHGVLNPASNHEFEPGTYEFVYRRSATECQGAGSVTTPAEAPAGSEKQPVQATVTGLLPGGVTYAFCLLARNNAGETAISPPETFTTLAIAPKLSAEAATNLTATAATLNAQINPDGAETTYHFEYDKAAYQEGEAPHGVSTPAATTPAASTAVAVSQQIEGLSANTTYHWRVTAHNQAGTATGPDHTFIYAETTNTLPDNRAYEMVTPPAKNGALIGVVPLSPSPEVSEDGSHLEMLTIQCFAQAPSCVPVRQTTGVPYLFSRGAGDWGASSLAPSAESFETYTADFFDVNTQTALFSAPTPPHGEDDFYARTPEGASAVFTDIGPLSPPNLGENILAVQNTRALAGSADLSHLVYESEALWPESGKGAIENGAVYQYVGVGNHEPALVGVSGGLGSRDLISECVTTLGSPNVPGLAAVQSSDGHVVYFRAQECKKGTGANGGIPVPVGFELFARVDGGEPGARTLAVSEPRAPQTPSGDEPDPEGCKSTQCLENTASPAEPSEVNPNWREARFLGASSDGQAFFSSEQQLTDTAIQESNNLYLYDINEPEGHRLLDASQAEGGAQVPGGPRVQGALAYSSDASHVYFVAQGVLTEKPGPQGRKAADGANNLYVFEHDPAHPQGRVAFISQLSAADTNEWSEPGFRANVTPDGRDLVFISHAPLTPDVTRSDGAIQVFRYDAATEQLVRVTIGQDGFNDNGNDGAGNAQIVPGTHGYSARLGAARSDPTMSNDGARVFFMSPVALTSKALNSVQIATREEGSKQVPVYALNVYEWEREGAGSCPAGHAQGCVYLISDGHDVSVAPEQSICFASRSSTCLLGTDSTGSNVFFTTADELVPKDTDTQLDVYDARVCEPDATPANPCITEPPAGLPPCLGESCHGIPPERSSPLTGGSETLNRAGNPTPSVTTIKPLTNAQKLAKALKACRKKYKHSKKRRSACEKQAHKTYRPTAKKAKRATNNGRIR